MDRRAFTSLALSGLTWPLISRPAAAALDARELAREVERAHSAVQSYRAKFKQRDQIFRQEKGGTVWFERPNKLSFNYDNGNRVVSDGRTVQIYERANEQVYVRSVTSVMFPVWLSFLTEQSGFTQSYGWRLLSPAHAKYAKGHVLSGTPLRPSTVFRQALYYMDGKTFHVRRVVVEDHQHNRARLDFDAAVLNPKLGPDTFSFEPPPTPRVHPAP
ncbi:MAG TPA: outer membrane lipoprotein carrier protein LolA [Polyangiaceae bacterium]|nr:outer membrane lipoprotein carrier protein LolA [Polyangiaceae bacterium]